MAIPQAQARAMIALQDEMRGTRASVDLLAAGQEEVQKAVDLLKDAATEEAAKQEAKIELLESRIQKLLFTQKFDLLDSKSLTPDLFRGRRSDAFKPWARKPKNYCNAKKASVAWAEGDQSLLTDSSDDAKSVDRNHVTWSS